MKKVLVTGPEKFFANRAVADLKSELAKLGPYEQTIIEASDELPPGTFFAASSPTLLGGNRLLIVECAETLEENLASELLEVTKLDDPELAFVFIHRDGRRNKKLLAELKEMCFMVEAKQMEKAKDFKDFIVSEVARYKRKISTDAVDSLLTSLGNDVALLAGAINQITAVTSGNITAAMVAEYYDGIAELKGYHVSDPLWAGDLTQALEKFRWLVMHDGTGANIQVVAAIASDLRSMVKIMGAPAGQSDADIAASIGMPAKVAWKVPILRSIARSWKPSALAYFTNRLAEIDAQVKGSSIGAGLDETARSAVVEKFLIEIARK